MSCEVGPTLEAAVMSQLLQASAASFSHSHSMEPHHRRRLEIIADYPEIRALMGFDRTTVLITAAVVGVQLALAYSIKALSLSWWFAFLLAYALGAILSHWAGQAIHETSHNLACRTPRGNQALALFANLPMVFPIAATFRRYHLDHHLYLGVQTLDTDLPHALEVKYIGRTAWRKALWLYFYFFVYFLRGLTFIKRPNSAEVLNFCLQMGFNVALFFVVGPVGLFYLAASTIIGHSLHPVAAHFIHEHYLFSQGQETYSYCGPLNWVTFNVGYHVEHHDFMSVPGRRLPRLRAIALKYYDGLNSHHSWTWVLWHFVISTSMGVGNRMVRSVEDHAQGGRHARQQPMPQWGA
jgi:sphingolipid 4-desaturase/C4-monooxygenase